MSSRDHVDENESKSAGKADASTLLTLNAGSSSLKFAVFSTEAPSNDTSSAERQPKRIVAGDVSRIGHSGATLRISKAGEAKVETACDAPDQARALEVVLEKLDALAPLSRVVAVGHRIVHGGRDNDGARLVTKELLEELNDLSSLDPNHMPSELALVRAMQKKLADIPHVACFDTAFHRTMPRVARLVSIDRKYEEEGIERYGFHGLSYAFVVSELERVAGREAAQGRLVVAHLGSGSSLAAIHHGRSVDTTMGFTPTSGVMMGTRSGDLDPGILLYLLRKHGLDSKALDELVNARSGLLGVSGTSSDVRDLLEREATDERAKEALALFCYQVKKSIGALATVLGGIDTLVFTGGIGENSPEIRARIADGLEHLGITLDETSNEKNSAVISQHRSSKTVRIVQTDEEVILARQTAQIVASQKEPS